MKIRGNTITILQRSLLLAGGTMEGTLKMNGNSITGLPAPSKTTDAVRKTDLDKMVPLAGGSMTGPLSVPLLEIPQLTGTTQAIRFLNDAGNMILTIYPETTSKNFRVRQIDLDSGYSEYFVLAKTSGLTENATYKILTSKDLISIAEGGTNAKTAAQALANLGGLPLSGGKMTGSLNMNSNAVTGLPEPSNSTDAVRKKDLDKKLSLSGGKMTGALNMNSNSITNVPAPTAAGHAVNKTYADAIKDTATNALTKANEAYSDANAAGATAYTAQQIANAAIPSSQKGAVNGVATLNANSKVLPAQTRSTLKLVENTAYTIKPEDEGYMLRIYGGDGNNFVITLPGEGTNDLPTGAEIEICRYTNKTVTIQAPSDRYLLYPECSQTTKGGSLKIAHNYGCVALKKVASQSWIASGDIE